MSLLGRAFVPIAITVAFALFRRYAPAQPPPSAAWTLAKAQTKERLPIAVLPFLRLAIALGVLATYFAYKAANHAWARLDGPQITSLFATSAFWWFFPIFGCLSLPWTLPVWLLRHSGRTDEADAITEPSDQQTGFNTYRIMNGFAYCAVLIALATLLAIPIHATITPTQILCGRYARLRSEPYPLAEVTHAYLIQNSRSPNSTRPPSKDLILDFSDGRRLDLNPADPGDPVPEATIAAVLSHIPVSPTSLSDLTDLPKP